MRGAELGAAVLLVLGGLASLLWLIPAQTSQAAAFGLPPDLIPRLVAMAITGLGLVLILDTVRRWREPDPRPAPFDPPRILAALGAIALLVVGVILVHQAGVLAGGAFTVASFMVFLGERRWPRIVLVAGGAALTVHLAFTRVLNVPMG